MGYETLKVKIVGIAPLLMHNGQLADPLNPIVRAIKEITAKPAKKRSDSDLEELSRLEFMGGLYLNAKKEPAVPGENVEGMIRDGARKSRMGKDVECGVMSDGIWAVDYDGPKDIDKLWLDRRFRDYRGCGLKGSRIFRMRPKFPEWSLCFDISYEKEVINRSDIEKWLAVAGQFVGFLDFRPRFGRFAVDYVK